MKSKLFITLPIVGLLAGCQTLQTPQQRQQTEARQKAASRMVDEKLHRLQGQVESVELENARLTQDVHQLRTEVRSLNHQISQLGSGMQAIQTRQARDKQEVIDQVSKRVGTLLEKQSKRAPQASGREHVVEAGHTLSAIAKAYGTSVKSIKQTNKLKSDSIYVGQKLYIPE